MKTTTTVPQPKLVSTSIARMLAKTLVVSALNAKPLTMVKTSTSLTFTFLQFVYMYF